MFFDCNLDNVEKFARKIDVLFTWSVTSFQYGHHRPFAALSLLSAWQGKLSERAYRRDLISPQEFLQDRLFDWLDLSEAARTEENINAVTLLYGNLIERGLFCYATYIQRLVARGELGLSLAEVQPLSTFFRKAITNSLSAEQIASQEFHTLYTITGFKPIVIKSA